MGKSFHVRGIGADPGFVKRGWGEGRAPYTDEGTFDGIKRLQKDHGLKVGGVIKPGGETEAKLNQFNAKPTPKPAAPKPKPPPTVPGTPSNIPPKVPEMDAPEESKGRKDRDDDKVKHWNNRAGHELDAALCVYNVEPERVTEFLGPPGDRGGRDDHGHENDVVP